MASLDLPTLPAEGCGSGGMRACLKSREAKRGRTSAYLLSSAQAISGRSCGSMENSWTNTNVTVVVPDDYTSIQEAINAAISGQTIYVKAGTYYKNIVMKEGVNLVGMATPEEVIIAIPHDLRQDIVKLLFANQIHQVCRSFRFLSLCM